MGRIVFRICVCVCVLASAFDYHAAYLLVELDGVHEVFDVDVHTVAPVVAGVGGYVDALDRRIGVTEGLVYGEPVLEGEYA